MSNLDILVLFAYIVGVTLFGATFYRKAKSTEGFTVAGRNLPGWAVGLSIFGTYLSSISFLALPGKAYTSNWNAFVFSLTLPFAAWVASRWFAPLYRSTQDVSAYAYLERRFGYWARAYAMTFYLLTQLARMGTILFLVALALQGLTGWDIRAVIIVAGVLVTFYTLVGGIEAVIWTDVVQAIILSIGAIVSAFVLIAGIPGGFSGLMSVAEPLHKLSFGSFAPDLVTPTFWVVFVYGIVINLQNFGIDQSYIQRYQTARSLADARQSLWVGALTYLPVSALFLFIGTALYAYYQMNPHLLSQGISGDRVFPYFIVNQLPAGLTGLLIASLSAAAMSSVDTSINSSATILLADVYKRIVNPGASEATQMRFLRIVTLVLGIAGTGTALLMISIKNALDVWWNLAGIFSGGMLGLFLLGSISRKAAAPQAGIAMVTGILTIMWATLSRNWSEFNNVLHPFMTAVIGTLVIFLVGVALSRRNQERKGDGLPLTI
ncbi:MAG: sodium:solute symporter, partial [Acidiferrobacterales bacterium]|nr:sodium:solute symporter [Acidiferrobacterales bacterium]